MADIEQTRLAFKAHDKEVTASFTANTNVPARLQVWMHDPDHDGRVEHVDVRMFLRSLNLRRDTIPVDDGMMRTYLPGSQAVDAHLFSQFGWKWRFKTINGRRVAVPVEVRHGD